MNTDDIKKIAESLGLKPITSPDVEKVYVSFAGVGLRVFNPLTRDEDAFKVLEALVKKRADMGLSLVLMDMRIYRREGFECSMKFGEIAEGKTLNEAICKAYLNTIGEEG